MTNIMNWLKSKKDVILGAVLGGLATVLGLGLLGRQETVNEEDVQDEEPFMDEE